MAPATGTAVLVLAAFVLPGFVALRYSERTYVTKGETAPFERLLNALYFSFLTYVVIFAVALALGLTASDVSEYYSGARRLRDYVVVALAALLVPFAIAEGTRRWNRSAVRAAVLDRAKISAAHATPSGWEHFFLQGRVAFVRVTLQDKRVVGGYFGNKSFAGYTADVPDLFLEQRWVLDPTTDWFVSPAPGSVGLYVRANEIVSVEFYEVPPDPPSSNPPAGGVT